MMRVLVTGSAGFVGRHMVKAFTERGDTVFGIDVVEAPDDERSQVRDALDFFRSPWSGPGFDLAIHCAAVIGGRAGIDGSPLAVATNAALDAWFFRWLEQAQVRQAVYFSSSAAYPEAMQNDFARAEELREAHIRLDRPTIGRPDATYGWTKLFGEVLAQTARARGQQVLVVRPFSGYGSDQSGDYPFPALLRRVLDSQPGDHVEVWGNPESARDWIHIDDVVGAVLALLAADEPGPVNLGTGRATTFRSLIGEMAGAAFGWPHKRHVRSISGQPEGVLWRVADASRMEQFYKPQVSLREGIARAVQAARGGSGA
jgi:nucleoside-diphosphate-sugar epimerase